MSKLDELIAKLCSNGVEYKKLGEITIWDKKFKGCNSLQQEKVTFKHVSAKQLKEMGNSKNGDVKLLSTGLFDSYATTDVASDNVNIGEVISIPSGGNATIKYYSGKFVDSGNLLAISSDSSKYCLKYIYYWLKNNNMYIETMFRGSGIKHPDMVMILKIDVPIPPLEIQQKIVEILDKFTQLQAELQAELAMRLKQYEYYRDTLLDFNNAYNPEGGITKH